MDELVKYSEQTFEAIKHINEYGEEFWYARELRKVLQYTEFNKFVPVIKKAMTACENSGYPVSDHFAQVSEKVEIGSGAFRNMDSFALSRYACYLIVMCADETKEVVALGKTYFAVKTRQQELIEEYDTLSEDQKRLAIRNEMKQHNIALADAAKNAGVINQKDYAIFQNMGYKGLYGGLGAKEIHERKGLKKVAENNTAIITESNDIDTQTKQIMPGKSLDVQAAYALDDETTPVEIQIAELISLDDTPFETFTINLK